MEKQRVEGEMNIKEFLYHIGLYVPKPPVHTEEEMRESARSIVSRYAQGNISLQQGKYLTDKDIKKRMDKLATYNFR